MSPRRAALIRCRYAERYQTRTLASLLEMEEETAASRVPVSAATWGALIRAGLVSRTSGHGYRLTAEGYEALKQTEAS